MRKKRRATDSGRNCQRGKKDRLDAFHSRIEDFIEKKYCELPASGEYGVEIAYVGGNGETMVPLAGIRRPGSLVGLVAVGRRKKL